MADAQGAQVPSETCAPSCIVIVADRAVGSSGAAQRLQDPLRRVVMFEHVGETEIHHVGDVAPEMRDIEIGVEQPRRVQELDAIPKKPSTADVAAHQSAGVSLSTVDGGTLLRLEM